MKVKDYLKIGHSMPRAHESSLPQLEKKLNLTEQEHTDSNNQRRSKTDEVETTKMKQYGFDSITIGPYRHCKPYSSSRSVPTVEVQQDIRNPNTVDTCQHHKTYSNPVRDPHQKPGEQFRT